MLRSVLEVASRRVVIKKKLPANHGGAKLYVSPSGGLKLLKPTRRLSNPLFDIAAFITSPGDIIWDCGANLGFFGFPAAWAAGSGGRVLCIEPDPFCVDLLLRSNAKLGNEYAPLSIINAAMSDSLSKTRLLFASRGTTANHIAESRGTHTSQSGHYRTMDTVTLTLDLLLDFYSPPDVLKIDVEGAEHLVLAGARKVLGEHRPLLVLECEEYNKSEVTETLSDLDYKFFRLDFPPFEQTACCGFNALAVPSEKVAEQNKRGVV